MIFHFPLKYGVDREMCPSTRIKSGASETLGRISFTPVLSFPSRKLTVGSARSRYGSTNNLIRYFV
jgi:hypothetical protein